MSQFLQPRYKHADRADVYLPFVPRGIAMRALVPSALSLQAAHLGVPCEKAPLFSGFPSLCPDFSIALLWLWFLGALLMSSVHLSLFWALCLKYTHQAPFLEVKTTVFVPLGAGLSAPEPV